MLAYLLYPVLVGCPFAGVGIISYLFIIIFLLLCYYYLLYFGGLLLFSYGQSFVFPLDQKISNLICFFNTCA